MKEGLTRERGQPTSKTPKTNYKGEEITGFVDDEEQFQNLSDDLSEQGEEFEEMDIPNLPSPRSEEMDVPKLPSPRGESSSSEFHGEEDSENMEVENLESIETLSEIVHLQDVRLVDTLEDWGETEDDSIFDL